jgi:soluble lytic murein transglycosylase
MGTEVRGPVPRVRFLDRLTAQAESGNRDFTASGAPVRSPKGALFAMQVMPDTARDPGFGLRPANPSNPDDMNRLGREYRATMERRYGGDHAKMWAAYNAGPGRVDRVIQQHGDNWFQHLPAETRAYVQRNMTALRRGGGN